MRDAYLRKGMTDGGGFSREAEERKPLKKDGGARSPEIEGERKREFEGGQNDFSKNRKNFQKAINN